MYVKQNFAILFFPRSNKRNHKTGKVPIYFKLTIDGVSSERSVKGSAIVQEHWDPQNKCVYANAPQAKDINKRIREITTDLERTYDLVKASEDIATTNTVLEKYFTPLKPVKARLEKDRNAAFTAEVDDVIGRYVKFMHHREKAMEDAHPHPGKLLLLDARQKVLEKDIKKLLESSKVIFDDKKWVKTLMLGIDEYLLRFLELVQADNRSYTSLEKMWGRKRRIVEFLQARHKVFDLPFSSVEFRLLDDLLIYNIKMHKMTEGSCTKYLQCIKEVYTRAVANGWTSANIFDAYHCHYDETNRKWPTQGDLEIFRSHEFETPRQNLVRDCYVTGCYTAFAYAELYGLVPDMIVTGIDGKRWAGKDRRKTSIEECLPLLPIVLDILEKYKDHPICIRRGKCLPIPCNTVYNRELKKMAAQLGWTIKLDGHTARYFFINEVAFRNGIKDLKTLMKIVGIKSLKTLMVYLKGNNEAVSEDMQMVNDKLFNPDGTFKSEKKNADQVQVAKVIKLQFA